MVWLGLAAASRSEPIEITGLVDFGGVRMAFVKIGDPGQPATLRPGERAGDVMLRDFNSKEGWAVFLQGTNESKLWLHYSSAISPTPALSSVQAASSRIRLSADGEGEISQLVVGQSRQESESAPGSVILQAPYNYSLPPDAPMTPWLRAYLDANQAPRTSDPGRPASNLQGGTAPKIAPTPIEAVSPVEPNIAANSPAAAPVVLSGNTGAAVESGPALASTPSENPAPDTSVPTSSTATPDAAGNSSIDAANALKAEGEFIRGFYGMQAFFAWDMTHRNR
jgi:hypothetical protein